MNVAAQQRAIGDHDVAAQLAIVRHVAAGHQEIVAADRGDAVLFLGAAIDRHSFANHVMIADDHLRVAAAVTQVLGLAADHHARVQVIVLTQGDMAL